MPYRFILHSPPFLLMKSGYTVHPLWMEFFPLHQVVPRQKCEGLQNGVLQSGAHSGENAHPFRVMRIWAIKPAFSGSVAQTVVKQHVCAPRQPTTKNLFFGHEAEIASGKRNWAYFHYVGI